MSLLAVHTSASSPTTTTEWTTSVIQDVNMATFFIPGRQAFYTADTNHTYIMYYDGSGVRLGRGFGGAGSSLVTYHREKGLPLIYTDDRFISPGTIRVFEIDPTSFYQDYSKQYTYNTSNFANVYYQGMVWSVATSFPKYVVRKYNAAGTLQKTYTIHSTGLTTGFEIDGLWFSESGEWMYVTDKSLGLLRSWNLNTDTFGAQWSYSPAYRLAYDQVNDLLWTIRISDTKVVIYKMTPAPATITVVVGANRARYKQDSVTATVLGSESEPVPNWPVSWSLTGGSQGHLHTSYSVTNSAGVATNTYYGPGDNDYTGASQTIEATTGY